MRMNINFLRKPLVTTNINFILYNISLKFPLTHNQLYNKLETYHFIIISNRY